MNILNSLLPIIKDRFNLQEDKADEQATIDSIRKNVEFKGTNLWVLIFAIFVASIGLNVNSTAVIIGAMLISPLMGPIIGIGLGIGINDFELIKKAAKNLAIAVLFSVLTSTLYFFVSPLDVAQSELLARTTPTIWDVLIAFFGGLSGIIGETRRTKTNVIPGVAIATALMPPLCTAGFGLASGNMYYFFGAFYLFFINAVFISLSSFLIVTFLRFPKNEFVDSERERKVKRYVTMVVIITVLPSIYIAYNIVVKTIFEQRARNFVAKEFIFDKSQVIEKEFSYTQDGKSINLFVLGEPLEPKEIDRLRLKMSEYGLHQTTLVVKQGTNSTNQVDMNVLRANILEDLYTRNEKAIQEKEAVIASLQKDIEYYRSYYFPIQDFAEEVKAQHPDIREFAVNKSIVFNYEVQRYDTVIVSYTRFEQTPARPEIERLRNWLRARTKHGNVIVIERK